MWGEGTGTHTRRLETYVASFVPLASKDVLPRRVCRLRHTNNKRSELQPGNPYIS